MRDVSAHRFAASGLKDYDSNVTWVGYYKTEGGGMDLQDPLIQLLPARFDWSSPATAPVGFRPRRFVADQRP